MVAPTQIINLAQKLASPPALRGAHSALRQVHGQRHIKRGRPCPACPRCKGPPRAQRHGSRLGIDAADVAEFVRCHGAQE